MLPTVLRVVDGLRIAFAFARSSLYKTEEIRSTKKFLELPRSIYTFITPPHRPEIRGGRVAPTRPSARRP